MQATVVDKRRPPHLPLGTAHGAPSRPPSAPIWVYNVPPAHLPEHQRGPRGVLRPKRCAPACVPPVGFADPPSLCCGGRSASSWTGAGKLGDVPQSSHCLTARPLAEPAFSEGFFFVCLFVCPSPKHSLGSHQIKSQLAGLRHEAWCGMCSLARSYPYWGTAAEGRGRQEGPRGDLLLTPPAPTEASLVPWQVSTTRLGQPQHQCTQPAPEIPDPDTGASDLLTNQLHLKYWGFSELLCNTQCKAAAAAVIASNNWYRNTALNHLQSIHRRGCVPVSLPGGSQLAGNGVNACLWFSASAHPSQGWCSHSALHSTSPCPDWVC